MIRLAAFSRSDEFHRALATAADRSPDVRVELRLRSERGLGTLEWVDAIVVAEDRIDVIDRILAQVGPLPTVLVDAPIAARRWRDRLDGFADVAGDEIDRVVAAARAAAMGLDVSDPWRNGDPGQLPQERSDARRARRAASRDEDALSPPLTDREREILVLLARGLSNATIGQTLGVSPNTVKYHLAGIFAKLDATNRSEATWNAIQRGLLSL